MKIREVALTTIDNPYNPITQFDKWRYYDEQVCGYCTLGLLASISNIATDQSDETVEEDVETAIDELIEADCFGLYKKVVHDVDYAVDPNASNDD